MSKERKNDRDERDRNKLRWLHQVLISSVTDAPLVMAQRIAVFRSLHGVKSLPSTALWEFSVFHGLPLRYSSEGGFYNEITIACILQRSNHMWMRQDRECS